MAGVAWETANQIIQDAAYELGLITADVADVFASTDQNIIQLRQMLTRIGRDLVKAKQWSHLQKEGTITTSDSDADYDLPNDFDRLIANTYWNRTDDVPGVPVDGQVWQYFKAQSLTAAVTALFRIQDNEVQIIPTPSATESIAFEYISSYWVKESGQSAGNTTRADASTDTILFDPTLVMHALKLAFKRAKGLDSTAEQADYLSRLSAVAGGDGASPVLSLVPSGGVRLLDELNLPDTGWGS